MRSLQFILLAAVVGLFSLGCGNNGFINARGRVLKGGEPLRLSQGQVLRIFFGPTSAGGTRYDSFAASYNPKDGSFVVLGKDGRGLRPGNYHVGFQLMEKKEDLLGGRLLGPGSTLTVEVTPSSKDLVVDLDNTPFAKALEATTRKTALAAQSARRRMPR
jgi:hypothetical protein